MNGKTTRQGTWQTLKVSDGTEMRLYVATPEGNGKRPAIIVLQEAFGVNAHIRDVTERFAALDYVAVAPELYHRSAGNGFETGYEPGSGRDEAMKHLQALTNEGQEADLKAVFDWLKEQGNVNADRVAASGYCMGGRSAFLANGILPLRGAISYYGGRIAPDLLPKAATQSGPILFFWGGADTHIPQDQRDAVTGALDKAKKPYANIVFSEARHGFFCDARAEYDPSAAPQSWALVKAFLEEHLA